MILQKLIRAGLFAILIALASLAHAEAKSDCPPGAEQPTPEIVQAAMRDARDHGFLWRINKDGHTSYLYGTMHVGKFDLAIPGKNVMQALRASDTVALELDMLNADIQGRMVQGMNAQRSMALPEPLQKRMRQQADLVCVPYATLAKLSPELQVETLTLMVGRWDGLDASYAIDIVLAGMGHGANKSVVSLETPEAQLQLLQMKEPQQTITFVQESLDELESGRARVQLKRISTIWANADYAGMEHYNEWCDCLNTTNEREMMKRILDDRNPNLADRIDALHASGKRVFAAVGSLHMFGPLGLPMLMSQRGYRVERIDLLSIP